MPHRNQQILSLYRQGVSISTICRAFNLSREAVYNVVDRAIVRAKPEYTKFVQVVDIDNGAPIPENVVVWTITPPVGILASEIEVTE